MGSLDRHRHRLSVAPMMDWTDRHCRVFLRAISRHVLLYSEMVPVDGLLRGGCSRQIAWEEADGPTVAQLGGSDPVRLAEAARIIADAGFLEVNLNAGCPSRRVRQAGIGACLMNTPDQVARAVEAMKQAVAIPVTVKHRLGTGRTFSASHLDQFVSTIADAGCDGFIVHARLAELGSLTPKQNRSVPPLRHDLVHQLKARFPHLHIELNGGIESLAEARMHLEQVDGVMIGRAVYRNPFLLATADQEIFEDSSRPVPTRVEVLEQLVDHAESLTRTGEPIWRLVRHLGGLLHGTPGARRWRRFLSEHPQRMAPETTVLKEGLQLMKELERCK